MSELDEMVPEGFQPARFTGRYLLHNGPYYTRAVDDGHQVALRVGESHINYIDIAHGGVLTTLADVALSWPVYLSERPNPQVSTTSLTTNFVSPARLGDLLVASAGIDRLGRSVAHVHGAIHSGERLLMTMSGVFSIRRAG
jgi:uncharacterized protein (TIGR00369 family)